MKKFVLLFTLFAAACGDGYEIADGEVSGTIDSKSWSLKSATTDYYFSDDDSYGAVLYGGNDVYTCNSYYPDPDSPEVLLNIPRELGVHHLRLGTASVRTAYVGIWWVFEKSSAKA